MSHYLVQECRFSWISGIFVFWLVLVSAHEDISPSHQNTPDASTLKIKAKESEASITLGKNLILGPSLSTEASIVANISDSNDIMTTKIDLLAIPTIVSRVPFEERSRNVIRKPVSKNTNLRWSSRLDDHYWVNKNSKTTWEKDSYLEALRHSRTSDDPREGIVRTDSKNKANRREYIPEPVYKQETEYSPPDSTYMSKKPRIIYGGSNAPSGSNSYSESLKPSMDYDDGHYGAPQNSYGPMQNSYGSPNPSFYPQTPYGSSGNSYLPPQQGYGTSIHASPPAPAYGAPYALPDVPHISILPTFDLAWPLALKLNAFTVAKIILKLVIFKMIVKFIAVICLLLFIPKLEIIKKKGNKEEDEERSLSTPYVSTETLNNLESIVKSSVEKYEAQNGTHSGMTEKCNTLVCSITQTLTYRESWHNYLNLFKSYVEEERQFIPI